MPIGDPAAVTPTGVDGKVINRHLEQRLSLSHGTDTTRGQAGTRIGLIGYKAGLTIKQACATRCRRSRPMALTLATWNLNSLKVRLPHLLDWLGAHAVDVMCLQETKLPDDKFPVEPLQQAGYESVFAGQKTYNGVAILTRRATVGAATDVQANLPNFEDEQKRLIAATVAGVRVVCCYFPNGQAVGSDKYEYKLRWIAALNQWLRDELLRSPQLAVLGDYNVAPEDRDVHDPKAWEGQVLFSEPEKQAFRDLVALGLVDSFRMFEQPERSYTWWDYRMMAFRRKMGLRIDHVLLSPALAARCTQCTIDVEPRRREQPSDHAPVVVTLQ